MIKYSWYRWIKRKLGYRTFVLYGSKGKSYMSAKVRGDRTGAAMKPLLDMGWVEEK